MMLEAELNRLVEDVRTNCHIADARHARDMTMCNYLLGMRELYRWERGIPLAQSVPRDALGAWLSEREAHWERLEHSAFNALSLGGRHHDPFDIGAINAALEPHGLVYGAGYGRFGAPHFFLGDLLKRENRNGLTIFVAGSELARDLHAAPAAMREGAIFLRQDALRRWLWEKMEIWGVRKAEGALKSAIECYGFDDDAEAALDRMAVRETETLILHEIGECMAEPLLGPDWAAMLASFTERRAEILARAVRDNLADCLSTLPVLLERDDRCALHFYFANFDGMRSALFPSLMEAYRVWRESDCADALHDTVRTGRTHWHDTAARLLLVRRSRPQDAERRIGAWASDPGQLAL